MLSSAPRLALPLFVSLSLVLATLVEANDFNFNKRDHGSVNMKRIIKKRQGLDSIFGPVAAGAQDDPTVASSSSALSSSSSVSQTASASASETSAASSTESAASSTESSQSASSTEQSSSASSTAASSTSAPAPAAPTSETLNLTAQPTPSNVISTVIPTVTRTENVGLSNQTTIPDPQSNAQKENSTTLTIIIAVAASLGGIAILWTVFRKWKLSSSKKFDSRLNPIDFQPTVSEDDIIPSHRRALSNGSSRSGRTRANASDRALEQHDFTAGPMASNVGGYADLSRGPSPTQMSEQLTRGPSLNRDYDYGVPIHHQGTYGNASYNPRY
ncbi:hypothetical protein CVT24_006087 [Panaeolus cyanescens]|uniref:Mid2 domain-containing protein n=1 Tax=Panaeolus cyanescens TaxID=181874 RepID=A0A409V8R7_9AGAR|nr:hypothetical protein CVT24_006087 [Panaeolus cyanescens]